MTLGDVVRHQAPNETCQTSGNGSLCHVCVLSPVDQAVILSSEIEIPFVAVVNDLLFLISLFCFELLGFLV